jgi:hypothetical protein
MPPLDSIWQAERASEMLLQAVKSPAAGEIVPASTEAG